MTFPNFQLDFSTWLSTLPKEARGKTCEDVDEPRLNEQGKRVYKFMRDLRVHTLKEISIATGDPEASVSARIREIRRYLETNGLGTILRERVEDGNGLHTYSMRLHRTYGQA